eukprot:TRINITY_DN2274_c0_g4_i1.p1 TRINITY_DN2274_c0_g4~~TRINITY_DN2274_c0_g4_i1.p1  ORF type:complete len:888 (-),score=404.51 TRINITY_DN2274_c0_g4_i1:53-2689(-)
MSSKLAEIRARKAAEKAALEQSESQEPIKDPKEEGEKQSSDSDSESEASSASPRDATETPKTENVEKSTNTKKEIVTVDNQPKDSTDKELPKKEPTTNTDKQDQSKITPQAKEPVKEEPKASESTKTTDDKQDSGKLVAEKSVEMDSEHKEETNDKKEKKEKKEKKDKKDKKDKKEKKDKKDKKEKKKDKKEKKEKKDKKDKKEKDKKENKKNDQAEKENRPKRVNEKGQRIRERSKLKQPPQVEGDVAPGLLRLLSLGENVVALSAAKRVGMKWKRKTKPQSSDAPGSSESKEEDDTEDDEETSEQAKKEMMMEMVTERTIPMDEYKKVQLNLQMMEERMDALHEEKEDAGELLQTMRGSLNTMHEKLMSLSKKPPKPVEETIELLDQSITQIEVWNRFRLETETGDRALMQSKSNSRRVSHASHKSTEELMELIGDLEDSDNETEDEEEGEEEEKEEEEKSNQSSSSSSSKKSKNKKRTGGNGANAHQKALNEAQEKIATRDTEIAHLKEQLEKAVAVQATNSKLRTQMRAMKKEYMRAIQQLEQLQRIQLQWTSGGLGSPVSSGSPSSSGKGASNKKGPMRTLYGQQQQQMQLNRINGGNSGTSSNENHDGEMIEYSEYQQLSEQLINTKKLLKEQLMSRNQLEMLAGSYERMVQAESVARQKAENAASELMKKLQQVKHDMSSERKLRNDLQNSNYQLQLRLSSAENESENLGTTNAKLKDENALLKKEVIGLRRHTDKLTRAYSGGATAEDMVMLNQKLQQQGKLCQQLEQELENTREKVANEKQRRRAAEHKLNETFGLLESTTTNVNSSTSGLGMSVLSSLGTLTPGGIYGSSPDVFLGNTSTSSIGSHGNDRRNLSKEFDDEEMVSYHEF